MLEKRKCIARFFPGAGTYRIALDFVGGLEFLILHERQGHQFLLEFQELVPSDTHARH